MNNRSKSKRLYYSQVERYAYGYYYENVKAKISRIPIIILVCAWYLKQSLFLVKFNSLNALVLHGYL